MKNPSENRARCVMMDKAVKASRAFDDEKSCENDVSIPFCIELFDSLLSDADNGVNEQSFNLLREMAERMDSQALRNLLHCVKATDGRFYLPE